MSKCGQFVKYPHLKQITNGTALLSFRFPLTKFQMFFIFTCSSRLGVLSLECDQHSQKVAVQSCSLSVKLDCFSAEVVEITVDRSE